VWMLSSVYLLYGSVDKAFVKQIKKKNIPLITYTTCSMGIPFDEMKKTFEPFDYAFIHNERMVEMLEMSNVYYMPVGFYKDQYFPMKIKPTIDISFAGNPQSQTTAKHDKRVAYLKKLIKKFNIKVYGEKLCKRVGCRIRPYNTHKQQRKIYATTRVNLDLPFMNSRYGEYKDDIHLKNRFFEIPACKRILLTQYSEEADRLLTGEVETFYYRNFDELVQIIKYILENFNESMQVAKAGYQRVKAEHQFKHRFQKMMEMING
jgi:spore maturation protein CgeB